MADERRRASVPGVPGVALPDHREENAILRRRLREAEQAQERLLERSAELVREKSVRPPPVPMVEPVGAPIVIHGPGWKATIPAALLLAATTAVGTRMLPTATASDAKLDRIEDRQARSEKDVERARAEQDRVNNAILQRLDRIETSQSVNASALEDLRRRLRELQQ
jgi:hypothetical protein